MGRPGPIGLAAPFPPVRDKSLPPSPPRFPPPLRTVRLTLEPLRVGHADEMFEGLADPALYRFMADQPPADLDELQARYRQIATGRSPDGADLWCNWIIRRDIDGRCLGLVQATLADGGDTGTALIGYMIFPPFWRQGIATEAITGMLGCLFDRYRCQQADAIVDTRNDASLMLLAGLGFEIVGRTEDGDVFDGAPAHEYELVLDRARWEAGTGR
ncbi:GNAT family N-acetyltransferase [Lichenicola cladoniae]|uniref:GNAT family N-acetyltransferase n=1 Tax=Lichenicola cladoniae TaxID=1484109 RepID=A0A6M8HP95_9PROT|nr:GNAT family N-acetyltransferase [Lichenicola cladoniae]NPD68419.1 GNAT family N-acetyltransferase [Acetobacteraceae bacterium]QKE90095.1 GNAT family N-acetyltransferase [Lichenicola cladoniae]